MSQKGTLAYVGKDYPSHMRHLLDWNLEDNREAHELERTIFSVPSHDPLATTLVAYAGSELVITTNFRLRQTCNCDAPPACIQTLPGSCGDNKEDGTSHLHTDLPEAVVIIRRRAPPACT